MENLQETTSLSKIILNKFFSNKLAVLGLVTFVILLLVSIFMPFFLSQDIRATDLTNMAMPPSKEHILGTDNIGRDVFTRLIYGGRVSIGVGILATAIQVTIGVVLGLLAGYFGGFFDLCIMRITDTFMCFPFFIMAISISAVINGSAISIILIIGLLAWPKLTRIVRSSVIDYKEREFVESAKIVGASDKNIILTHILPNVFPQIMVYTTISVVEAVLTESSLSFLGMGIEPTTPSWGNMLAEAQKMRVLTTMWWMWVPPGLLILLLALSVNFVGDGLRESLSPEQDN